MRWIVVLLVLAGLLLLADRLLEGMAERRVADEVAAQADLAGTPQVDIAGFPFLVQALAGRYERVSVSLSAADLGQPPGTSAVVVLHGVRLPLGAALSGSVRGVPVERIDGTATLSYDLLSAQLREGATVQREGDGLRIDGSLELLGQRVPLSATGTVRLERNEVVVDVDEATGAGAELPDVLVDRVADLLDLRYPVPALPYGLEVTGVRPVDEGVQVTAEATDTVLPG